MTSPVPAVITVCPQRHSQGILVALEQTKWLIIDPVFTLLKFEHLNCQ